MDNWTENIPQELKNLPNWVVYRQVLRKDKSGRTDKIPYNPNDIQKMAKTNDSSTWASFDQAVEMKFLGDFDGVGFVFVKPYVGIDIDHCVENGKLSFFAQIIIQSIKGYIEYSPSGLGIHIIAKGELPAGKRKNSILGLEMYDSGRFFTVTGNSLNGGKI